MTDRPIDPFGIMALALERLQLSGEALRFKKGARYVPIACPKGFQCTRDPARVSDHARRELRPRCRICGFLERIRNTDQWLRALQPAPPFLIYRSAKRGSWRAFRISSWMRFWQNVPRRSNSNPLVAPAAWLRTRRWRGLPQFNDRIGQCPVPTSSTPAIAHVVHTFRHVSGPGQ